MAGSLPDIVREVVRGGWYCGIVYRLAIAENLLSHYYANSSVANASQGLIRMTVQRVPPAPPVSRLSVGDPMPRITLPMAAGGLFDSWDQANAGRVQVYWLGENALGTAEAMAATLAACEAEWRTVTRTPQPGNPTCLIDKAGDFGRAFGVDGPTAVVVDASGRLAAISQRPDPESIVALVQALHAATDAQVVTAQAPVLLVDHVVEPVLCAGLIDHWHRGGKLADGVASAAGASNADADTKRRRDVPVDDKQLFMALRESLVRRVVPAIFRAFQARIMQVELPRIGCYDSESGGWFRRHRDNTTPFTAHRQFAISVNLNPTQEYDGGEVRFPEFGRQLYRPPAGGALVFSCSLLHEVIPLRRGRRFGLFSFLHDESRDAQYRSMLAQQKAKGGLSGIHMRCAALWLSALHFLDVAVEFPVV
jgi:predicted 2-oxoglutarate/Fe(II)-dependent dioxygenase YbiX